ncbi:MAG: phosphoribosylanthranilate isomerase [Gammaproteobacteria bacterium]|jgi:phosphoribosylanthranilate isomerase
MSKRTRIKICGITRQVDADLIVSLGVDSIGLVFYPPSPRKIEIEAAIKMRNLLPPFVTVTALFLNDSAELISSVIEQVQPDLLQFHGQESEACCHQWKMPYIKSIPMGETLDPKGYANQFPSALGFLLDSNMAGRQGGSGDTFDWSKIPSKLDFPLVLAGGLNPGNVAEAITQVNPWAVDVSSGVEVSKGIKDADLVKQFIKEVNRVDGNA